MQEIYYSARQRKIYKEEEGMSALIKFKTFDEVHSFVKDISDLPSEIDLKSLLNHRYCVDAKSLLGVFALDIGNVLKVTILSSDESELQKFENLMEKYKYIEN